MTDPADPSPQSLWRPPPRVRPLALGVVAQADRLLVSPVTDDKGRLTGWRPLGGEIEFGEAAEAALRREFQEELGRDLGPTRLLGVLENRFALNGAPGHEICLIFLAALAVDAPTTDAVPRVDGGAPAQWRRRDALISGQERLFPDALTDLIRQETA